jgi:hypothetical protein
MALRPCMFRHPLAALLLFLGACATPPTGATVQCTFEDYQRLAEPKALAAASENRPRLRVVCGWASGEVDEEAAVQGALRACESERRKAGIATPCRTRLIGSREVHLPR